MCTGGANARTVEVRAKSMQLGEQAATVNLTNFQQKRADRSLGVQTRDASNRELVCSQTLV